MLLWLFSEDYMARESAPAVGICYAGDAGDDDENV